MLNVLLVDDEKLERVLIRKGYNWEENGFNIVGEAASEYMYVPVNHVFDIPFTNIVHGKSNTFKAPVTANTTHVQILFLNNGSVTYLTCWSFEAPSISAASYKSSGIPLNPVSKIMK